MTHEITVVKVGTPTAPGAARIHCGRSGPLGNPHVMRNKSQAERDRVCDEHVRTFGTLTQLQHLARIKAIAKTCPVELECYCAPLRCHCDFLRSLLLADLGWIIAGGRDYVQTAKGREALNSIRPLISCVYSGAARGADKWGEAWAKTHGIEVEKYPADWDRYGKRAGPIRNRAMAEWADGAIIFKGGRGTADMFNVAKGAGLITLDLRNLS